MTENDSRMQSFDADDAARERALDIEQSFLVQAPAGSGKTGLLIQRYLALLAHVDRPERIVAMTFTRKAAGEMRERIVAALRDATTEPPAALTAHAARTRELARAVLAQDAKHGWQLVDHPSRLAVYTIDAFAAALAQQAPLATGLGGAPHYEERATPLYVEAARAALARAAADDSAWRRLLAHLDNDADRLVELLAEMLGKRDQWIEIVFASNRKAFRADLEATLGAEIAGELNEALRRFPEHLVPPLVGCLRYAAPNLAEWAKSADAAGSSAAMEFAQCLARCAEQGALPPPSVVGLQSWRALSDWLLRGDAARFRKAAKKKNGFPAIGNGEGAALRRERNGAMTALLRELADVPQLAEELHTVRRLPPPRYTDEAWAIVDALLDVLLLAVEELRLTFRTAGAIDFVQGTLAALTALGDADAPSDLLLRLDFQIQHLLIDEFQDTSFTQVDLIRRLTAGWQPDDGRTLFAVGDPMQSIYRFRGAEVRIVVEAQQRLRIADWPVENLLLRRNFRSDPSLVRWVNEKFPHVLGATSDAWRGTVGFAAATAAADPRGGSAITAEIFVDDESEALASVGHVQEALATGAESIAVLVRARSHLDALLPAFRAAGIGFAAVDLDALAERQSIVDLVSLTHALLQPDDGLAWLAVLRAPWCGLSLDDLFAVTAAADASDEGGIAALLDTGTAIAGLSDDGRVRFSRVAAVLSAALDARGRAGLAARIRGAWLALGGPTTVAEPIDIDAAERFFALLADHEVAGDLPDWPAFVDALSKLYAAPDGTDDARVQVMTLHRAKGLEFDTVILPGLAQWPAQRSVDVLRWRRRQQGMMLAPMNARGGADDAVYTYLGMLAAGEESAELARLLYVGCTRAKRRLHLTAVLPVALNHDGALEWKPPRAGTALAKFWDVLEPSLAPPVGPPDAQPTASPPPLLHRLPSGWSPPEPDSGVPVVASPPVVRERIPFDWARETARHSGTVAHRLFAQIAQEGLLAWDGARIASVRSRVRAELAGAGVDDAELDAAVDGVLTSVSRLVDDPRGRWLFDEGHEDARSEWPLAGIEADGTARVVLDRSFVADGVRWIVDFKTGSHEGGDVEAFLDSERERYRAQLERYGRLMRGLDPRPIRLGLYFPLQAGWREWPYDG